MFAEINLNFKSKIVKDYLTYPIELAFKCLIETIF